MKPRYVIVLCTWAAVCITQVHNLFELWHYKVHWFLLSGYGYDIQWYFKDLGVVMERVIYIGAICYLLRLPAGELDKLRKDKAVSRTFFTWLIMCAWDVIEFLGWANHNWGTTQYLVMGYLILTLLYFTPIFKTNNVFRS